MPPFEPNIHVDFDRPDRRYMPGESIVVRYEVDGLGERPLLAVERSLLWYTEGKGEEDIGVHFFDRRSSKTDAAKALEAGSFMAVLPASPLSYEGVIVKVRWCIRIRIFFSGRDAVPERLGGSRDFVSEHVFEVGTIPPAAMNIGAQTA